MSVLFPITVIVFFAPQPKQKDPLVPSLIPQRKQKLRDNINFDSKLRLKKNKFQFHKKNFDLKKKL